METYPPALRRSDLVDLTDDGAIDGSLVGAKAANLARARRAGLPVLPGLVLTTAWDHRGWSHPSRSEPARPAPPGRRSVPRASERWSSARRPPTRTAARRRWPACSTSVLDVRDLAELRRRRRPRSSARGGGPTCVGARMAVLVQPQLAPRWGGVLFAADPVTGRTDRLLLAAVEGGPDRLVSGLDDGWTAVLSPRGRVLEDAAAARPCPSAAPRCGRSPGWRPGPARPSAARRTSSGPSTTTAPCGCCRAAPSPRRPGDPAARSSAPVRWPRRSPSR